MATVLPQQQSPGGKDGVPAILVVEDNSDDFFFIKRAFAQATASTPLVRALDGKEAKVFLERALTTGPLPICIVADLMMPVMDGFELLMFVKSHPVLKAIPMVILSASANQRDITRAYQLGVNSYIVKPNRFEVLVTITQALRDQWLGANLPPVIPPGAPPAV